MPSQGTPFATLSHILCTTAFRNFKTYESLFGTDQAIKVIENEFGTLYALDELVKKEGVCPFETSSNLLANIEFLQA